MIQNIVLDIGNVLVHYEPLKYLRKFAREESEVPVLCSRIFQSDLWLAGDAGTMTREESILALCARYPEDRERIRNILENCDEMLTAVEENTVLLRKLKEAGFSLYFLSNTNPSAFDYMTSTHEFFRYLDGGVPSFRVRQMKPGREIYETFLKTYGLSPESCVFVDDTPANTDTARSLGMHTVLLSKPELLEECLLKWDDIRNRLSEI